MAKQSKPTVKNRARKNQFTTVTGRLVKVSPISMVELNMAEDAIEQRYRDDGLLPDPPTYSVKIADSEEVETHSHTEATIGTEEDTLSVAEWNKYRTAWDLMENEQGEIRQEIMFVDGINEDPDEDTAWEKRQIRRGIKIPKDADARKLHWIRTDLLKTVDDILMAAETILIASMGGAVPADVLSSVKANFRLSIQDAAEELSGSGDTA